MKYPTLYSRDAKGKLLEWTIKVQQNGMSVDIMKSYGEFEGGQSITWQRNIEGKNIGKSNETSPLEQANLVAESNIKRKKDKGYIEVDASQISTFNNLREALETIVPKFRTDASGDVKPMKAQQYYRSSKNWTAPDGSIWDDRKYFYLKNPYLDKEPKSIITKFPCFAQPKINGVRAILQFKENSPIIKSKEGLTYRIPHILGFMKANTELFKYRDLDLIFDGELYIHGEILGDISSAVNKISLSTPRLKFILFDIAIPDKTQGERWDIIKDIRKMLDYSLECPIEIIKTFMIKSDKEAQIITDKFISEGYEGSIFRDPNAIYKFGSRPVTMTKLKRTISHEFKITNVLPQEKDNTKGNFQCVNKDGLYFEVNPMGTDDYKRELLDNKRQYIGKNLTVVFYEWTADKKPFHVLEATVRDYE